MGFAVQSTITAKVSSLLKEIDQQGPKITRNALMKRLSFPALGINCRLEPFSARSLALYNTKEKNFFSIEEMYVEDRRRCLVY